MIKYMMLLQVLKSSHGNPGAYDIIDEAGMSETYNQQRVVTNVCLCMITLSRSVLYCKNTARGQA